MGPPLVDQGAKRERRNMVFLNDGQGQFSAAPMSDAMDWGTALGDSAHIAVADVGG